LVLEQIGGYYQCYSNKKSLNFVLTNFRKNYNQSTIILVNDGGLDFSEEANKFNCNYFYEKKINTKKNLIFEDLNSMKEFIYRFHNYLKLIKEEFFILLEDDVFLIKKIESKLDYEINGCNKNEFFSPKISQIIKNKNNQIISNRIYYGAFGGCILKTNFFQRIFSEKEKIDIELEIFYNNSLPSDWASDKILSYFCLINQGKIDSYDGICETWYSDYKQRLESNNIEVLHQYKEFY
jgi:hypothetical protein